MLTFHDTPYLSPKGIVVGLQSTVNFTLSGWTILIIAVVVGAVIGWNRGIRALITVALVSAIAYIICVLAGDLLIAVINRFYQNGPKLFAFAAGRDPGAVAPLPPLIEPGFRIPLVFRMVLFVALLTFGWFFRKTRWWYWPTVSPIEPLARPLGAFIGAFTALVWVSAITAFWVELYNSGSVPFNNIVCDILLALPDVTPYMPALITVFFLVLGVTILFLLPRLFEPHFPVKK